VVGHNFQNGADVKIILGFIYQNVFMFRKQAS